MTLRTTIPLLTLLAGFAAPVAPVAAAVDDVCLPDAQPAPDWWSPMLSAAKREARWKHAWVNQLDDGTHAARMRAIWSPQGDAVYVEVRVDGDPALDAEGDAFVLAITDDSQSAPQLLIRFTPVSGCANWFDCDGAGAALGASAIHYAAATMGTSLTWTALDEVNPSTDFAVAHPWVVVERSATFSWTLSFVLEVPTDGSGDFVGRRLYGNAIAYDPGVTTGTFYELPLLCTPTSLTSNDCLLYSGPAPQLPQALPVGIIADAWPLVEAGACVP